MKILIHLLLLSALAVSASARELSETKIRYYFDEIAIKQEFSSKDRRVKKWVNDIKIYCHGEWSKELKKELETIIKDLTPLVGNIKLKLVDNKNESNYVIFIGAPEKYVSSFEPQAKKFVKNNFGLFWIYWDDNYQINRGSMYIDPKRAKTSAWQKHLLREELTQSLGLMNDSNKYKDSIFYKGHSLVNSYSKLDKTLIKILYSEEIKPNMSKKDAIRAIKKHSLIKK